MPDLDTNQWLTIVGWAVAFVLGLGTSLIVQRRGRDRRVLKWTVVSETSLLSAEVLGSYSKGFGVPIKVLVDGVEEADLSVIRLKIGNAGNVDIQDATLFFNFGQSAQLHVCRYVGDSEAYGQHLELSKETNSANLKVGHLNPGSEFDFEFLLANYSDGDVAVDLAEAGVRLRRVEFSTFYEAFGEAFLAGLTTKISPGHNAIQIARLADEVQRLRRIAERALQTAPASERASQQGDEVGR